MGLARVVGTESSRHDRGTRTMPAEKRKKRARASAPAVSATPPLQEEPYAGRYVLLVLGIILMVMAVLRADGFLYAFAEEPAPPWITACLGVGLVFGALSEMLPERLKTPSEILQGLAGLKLVIFFGWLLFG